MIGTDRIFTTINLYSLSNTAAALSSAKIFSTVLRLSLLPQRTLFCSHSWKDRFAFQDSMQQHLFFLVYSFLIAAFSLWERYDLLDMLKSRLHINVWRMEWKCSVSNDVFDPTHYLYPQQSCKPCPLYTRAYCLHVAEDASDILFSCILHTSCVWLWILEIVLEPDGVEPIRYFCEKGQYGNEKN